MSRFLFLGIFFPLTLSVVLRDINLNLTDFLISIILIFLKVRHKFRRRFHRAVFAHFTHTVRSLKMTDFYLYFCRLRSRFCRLRSRFSQKIGSKSKTSANLRFSLQNIVCFRTQHRKKCHFFADCGKNSVRCLKNSSFAAIRTKLPMK